ncbi:MAG: hypothetical protein ABIC36_03180 [bacterium]
MRTALLKIYDSFSFEEYFSQWQDIIILIKIFSFIISLALLIAIIYLIIKLRKSIKATLEMALESTSIASNLPKKEMDKKWESILEKLETKDENAYKMAVIEADNMVDNMLKATGYQGEDMGERLKQITSAQLANINELWEAHKVRNRLAHETDFHLSHGQAKRAIEIYQRALENLEAI